MKAKAAKKKPSVHQRINAIEDIKRRKRYKVAYKWARGLAPDHKMHYVGKGEYNLSVMPPAKLAMLSDADFDDRMDAYVAMRDQYAHAFEGGATRSDMMP